MLGFREHQKCVCGVVVVKSAVPFAKQKQSNNCRPIRPSQSRAFAAREYANHNAGKVLEKLATRPNRALTLLEIAVDVDVHEAMLTFC